MSTLRELKGRIGSVASTEKITSAMKMISSAKMHKAEQALRRLVPFRSQIRTVMGHLMAADGEYSSPLIEIRDVKSLALVVFGTDDGLCGAYNINIFKELLKKINDYKAQYGESLRIILYPVGKKMVKAVGKITGGQIEVKAIETMHTRSTQEQINDFTEILKSEFLSGAVDKVEIAYMHFKSVSKQTVQFDQLLPVSYEALAESGEKDKNPNSPCIFEPDANAIFNSVLPLYIISAMQDISTENNASEAAARVMAMQSANDNAQKLLGELQLEYNKLRQQGITTELLDILGGQVER